ncbi:MAG: lipid-A-disaccharide synthase [Gammaproteobacteria bacterium]|nr:lipid-A-disaccharide synthase [Gammaproteobacteria bacterium]
MRIAIVAGERSGDMLGAGLLRALKQLDPDLVAEGIGGSGMQAEGLQSLYPMELLSVMGIVEVLSRYRKLRRVRRELAARFLGNPPDLFVAIDAPDFNLGLEKILRRAGIPTVHYVSPSVWAWRGYRLKGIQQAVTHMLTLFPFEADYYRDHNLPVTCVGHPLANELDGRGDTRSARQALGLVAEGPLIALLPGSRHSEYSRLTPLLVESAAWLLQRNPAVRFVVPLVNPGAMELFRDAIIRTKLDRSRFALLNGQSHQAMAAADSLILASGTATLEAAIAGKPMVVVYKQAWLTWQIYRRLVRVKHVALPNLLAGEQLVPELLQSAATASTVGQAALEQIEQPDATLANRFQQIRESLRGGGNALAAEVIQKIATEGRTGG